MALVASAMPPPIDSLAVVGGGSVDVGQRKSRVDLNGLAGVGDDAPIVAFAEVAVAARLT